MHKFAACFSVIFLLLALLMLCGILYYNIPQLLSGNKIVLFVFLNALFMVGVGIFFTLFNGKIILYLDNYRREKQI